MFDFGQISYDPYTPIYTPLPPYTPPAYVPPYNPGDIVVVPPPYTSGGTMPIPGVPDSPNLGDTFQSDNTQIGSPISPINPINISSPTQIAAESSIGGLSSPSFSSPLHTTHNAADLSQLQMIQAGGLNDNFGFQSRIPGANYIFRGKPDPNQKRGGLSWFAPLMTALASYGVGALTGGAGLALGLGELGSTMAGGAASGAIASTPTAIEEGSFTPLLKGTALGAAVAGAGSAVNSIGDYSGGTLVDDQSIIDQYIKSSNIENTPILYSDGTPQFSVDPTLQLNGGLNPIESYSLGGAPAKSFEDLAISKGIFDTDVNSLYGGTPLPTQSYEDFALDYMKSPGNGLFFDNSEVPLFKTDPLLTSRLNPITDYTFGNTTPLPKEDADWSKLLKQLSKLNLGAEGTSTPGITTRPGGGGRGLDVADYEGLTRGKKNSIPSGLGMDMLEGSEFPFDKLYNPYLEDYIQPTR
jgi:hypothetical protein